MATTNVYFAANEFLDDKTKDALIKSSVRNGLSGVLAEALPRLCSTKSEYDGLAIFIGIDSYSMFVRTVTTSLELVRMISSDTADRGRTSLSERIAYGPSTDGRIFTLLIQRGPMTRTLSLGNLVMNTDRNDAKTFIEDNTERIKLFYSGSMAKPKDYERIDCMWRSYPISYPVKSSKIDAKPRAVRIIIRGGLTEFTLTCNLAVASGSIDRALDVILESYINLKDLPAHPDVYISVVGKRCYDIVVAHLRHKLDMAKQRHNNNHHHHQIRCPIWILPEDRETTKLIDPKTHIRIDIDSTPETVFRVHRQTKPHSCFSVHVLKR